MTRVTMPLHISPSAGFDAPFELLEACHGRVRDMLALMARLERHVAEHGPDAQAQEASRTVLRYFDKAAPEHHRDEERHVFPLLRAAGHAVAVADRLEAEHRSLEALWAQARTRLAQWAEGTPAPADATTDAAWAAFVTLLARHADEEDAHIFPWAQAHADAAAQHRMGVEMADRRRAPLPAGPAGRGA